VSATMTKGRLLDVENVEAGYELLQVLWDVSLHVDEGEFVALLGPNGAGKTTALRTIAGFLKPLDGAISFRGRAIGGAPAHAVSRMGLGYVSESLNLFPAMSVSENLQVGANAVRDKAQVASTMDLVFQLFPRLLERRDQLAGTLSGGERKMLGMAQALIVKPKVLLMDEPTEGVAPVVVEQLIPAIAAAAREAAVVLVEQNIDTALALGNQAHILEQGSIVESGGVRDLHDRGILEQRLAL